MSETVCAIARPAPLAYPIFTEIPVEWNRGSAHGASLRGRPITVLKGAHAYHHGDLRKALIDEALLRIDRSGIASLSLSSIAKALGVSQAAPYRHFKDREALLRQVALTGVERFNDRLDEACQGLRGSDALAARCRAYIVFGTEHPGLYQLIFASGLLPSSGSHELLRSETIRSFSGLVDILKSMDKEQPRRAAVRVWLQLHGVVMLSIHGLITDRLLGIGDEQLLRDIVENASAGQ